MLNSHGRLCGFVGFRPCRQYATRRLRLSSLDCVLREFFHRPQVQGTGLVFASDGSAGPGGSDPRLNLSCWAVGAYTLEPSGPRRVGSITCLQPFTWTVPQTEQQAVFELLRGFKVPLISQLIAKV